MNEKTATSCEQALAQFEEGGVAGLLKQGEFSRWFSIQFNAPVTEQLIRDTFQDAASQLALEVRKHQDGTDLPAAQESPDGPDQWRVLTQDEPLWTVTRGSSEPGWLPVTDPLAHTWENDKFLKAEKDRLEAQGVTARVVKREKDNKIMLQRRLLLREREFRCRICLCVWTVTDEPTKCPKCHSPKIVARDDAT